MTFHAPKAKTSARGYGRAHQQARRTAAAQHQPTDPCAICQHPLGPMSPALHYDHDTSRTGYRGFAHGAKPCPVCRRRCNLSDGARRAQIRQRHNRQRPRPRITPLPL